LRSRREILADIFQKYTAMTGFHRDCLRYLVPGPGDGTDDAALPQTGFPLFVNLPPEIRDQIWFEALMLPPAERTPSKEIGRVCFIDESWYGIGPGRQPALNDKRGNLPLPIPALAHACRESRRVVMKRSRRTDSQAGNGMLVSVAFRNGHDDEHEQDCCNTDDEDDDNPIDHLLECECQPAWMSFAHDDEAAEKGESPVPLFNRRDYVPAGMFLRGDLLAYKLTDDLYDTEALSDEKDMSESWFTKRCLGHVGKILDSQHCASTVWTPKLLLRGLGSDAVMVDWSEFLDSGRRHPHPRAWRLPLATGKWRFLVSNDLKDRNGHDWVPWEASPDKQSWGSDFSLKKIYLEAPLRHQRPLDIYCCMSKRVQVGEQDKTEERLAWHNPNVSAAAKKYLAAQLVVDLYDDKTLSEILSLDTIVGPPDPRPRCNAYLWGCPNPGICLNCQRERWEREDKKTAEAAWLCLHKWECTGYYTDSWWRGREIFGKIEFNYDDPWVKDVLEKAPEFRPVVTVRIWAYWDTDAPELEKGLEPRGVVLERELQGAGITLEERTQA